MNFQFYLEKLENSDVFKNFKKQNPDAYLCSGFFVIDKQAGKNNQQHLDFFIPEADTTTSLPTTTPQPPSLKLPSQSSENNNVKSKEMQATKEQEKSEDDRKGKMFSFQFGDKIELVPIESFYEVPEKLVGCDFDFGKVEKIIEGKIKEENINKQIQKILLSLQCKKGKCFLVGTVFVSSLGLIKINIDLESMKVVDFEKKSFFDMINIFKKK